MKYNYLKMFWKIILNEKICTVCTFIIAVITVISFYAYLNHSTVSNRKHSSMSYDVKKFRSIGNNNTSISQNVFTISPVFAKQQKYKASLPIIFVGGYPRAGSELVKELIEYYANIHCNGQTHVITDALKMGMKWEKHGKELLRLKEARIDKSLLFDAFTGFVYEIIFSQSLPNASTLCVHESYSYIHVEKLNRMFPRSKFVFIIRDGRAVTHELMFNKSSSEEYISYYDGFLLWAQHANDLLNRCQVLGMSKCYMLRFEDLVISTAATIKNLLLYLGLHADLGNVRFLVKKKLVAMDYFSDRPELPQDALYEARNIATTLEALGYDSSRFVPQDSFQMFERRGQLIPISSKDLHSIPKATSDQEESFQ